MVNLSFETKYVYDKVAGAGAGGNCDHQNCKLRTVAGAEGFRVAELRVRQLKIVMPWILPVESGLADCCRFS